MRTKRDAPPTAAPRRPGRAVRPGRFVLPARPASARARVLAALAALLGGLTVAVALPAATGAGHPATPGAPVCAVAAAPPPAGP
ncbi:hypothetical protein OK074_6912, partial [Actinobacteria bacterium OK074]